MSGSVLVIDQGTVSTRAIVFGPDAQPVAAAQEEFPQYYPRPGWVEHDPRDLWRTACSTARIALKKAADRGVAVVALGIAPQRAPVVIWDRATGRPIHNAIVWQDRRTADRCAALRAEGADPVVRAKSGLLLDPYFSASKVEWLLDHVEGARARARRGELAFGTVDTFLLWRLTNGARHLTDATNASRTALYNIHTGRWDEDLCKLFRVPPALLPKVRDCADDFGASAPEHLGTALPVRSMIGDQQAALVGQACFQPGTIKATFGTGSFVLLNTGAKAVTSKHRLLTTLAYQFAGRRAYALEGSVFAAGTTVQWLRDGLHLVRSSAETGQLAAESDPDQPVYIVPAFTGLGAPNWVPDARGLITGLTRGSTKREIARAALEGVAYQTHDIGDAMRADCPDLLGAGLAMRADWTMQCVADLTDAVVDRPAVRETTALGAAYLAGLRAGVFPDPDAFAALWRLDTRFTPAMDPERRRRKLGGWRDAVARTLLGS